MSCFGQVCVHFMQVFPKNPMLFFLSAQSEDGLYLEWAIKYINLRVFQGFSRSLDWSCGRKAHKAVRFCRSLPPKGFQQHSQKSHCRTMPKSGTGSWHSQHLYLRCGPPPRIPVTTMIYYIFRFGNLQLKTFMCQKKMHPGRGPNPTSIFQKGPAPW